LTTSDVEVNHELRVGVWKGEADRILAPPQHPMPETIAIEGDRRVEIGDTQQEVIQLAKQGAVGVHRTWHGRSY
jgi:hypothetical protein